MSQKTTHLICGEEMIDVFEARVGVKAAFVLWDSGRFLKRRERTVFFFKGCHLVVISGSAPYGQTAHGKKRGGGTADAHQVSGHK